jgi:hypothetical protein
MVISFPRGNEAKCPAHNRHRYTEMFRARRRADFASRTRQTRMDQTVNHDRLAICLSMKRSEGHVKKSDALGTPAELGGPQDNAGHSSGKNFVDSSSGRV